MGTINITADAGFKDRVGSIGITFWSNDDFNGFDSVNYVVQNVIFVSNYEAELFGMYTGLLKLSDILGMKECEPSTEIPFFDSFDRIETVNIYCDNYPALSCSKVIHALGSTAGPLRMTRDMIINAAVDDFFHTMATFENTPVVALRTNEAETHIRSICEKLFDVFNFLKTRITFGSIQHVHGHTISGNKDIEKIKGVFCDGMDLVMIPTGDKKSFRFPSIKTANTFAELYSNCIADAVASRRLSELECFSDVCNHGDILEGIDRCELTIEHRSLVVSRRTCSIRDVKDITVFDIDYVSSLSIYPKVFDRIKQTFEKLFGIAEVEVMDEIEKQIADTIETTIITKVTYLRTTKIEKKTTKTKKR